MTGFGGKLVLGQITYNPTSFLTGALIKHSDPIKILAELKPFEFLINKELQQIIEQID